jgi:hypothetical protein
VAGVYTLDAPLSAVFAELGDPSPWFPLMKSAVWHGKVGGVGAVREVAVRTFGVFEEEMIAWDVDRRIAFTMVETSSPLISRMGEEMLVERAGNGTRFTWRMVAHLTMPGRIAAPVLRRVMARMNGLAAKRLARSARASADVRGTHAS